jgi:hypothetical protein
LIFEDGTGQKNSALADDDGGGGDGDVTAAGAGSTII